MNEDLILRKKKQEGRFSFDDDVYVPTQLQHLETITDEQQAQIGLFGTQIPETEYERQFRIQQKKQDGIHSLDQLHSFSIFCDSPSAKLLRRRLMSKDGIYGRGAEYLEASYVEYERFVRVQSRDWQEAAYAEKIQELFDIVHVHINDIRGNAFISNDQAARRLYNIFKVYERELNALVMRRDEARLHDAPEGIEFGPMTREEAQAEAKAQAKAAAKSKKKGHIYEEGSGLSDIGRLDEASSADTDMLLRMYTGLVRYFHAPDMTQKDRDEILTECGIFRKQTEEDSYKTTLHERLMTEVVKKDDETSHSDSRVLDSDKVDISLTEEQHAGIQDIDRWLIRNCFKRKGPVSFINQILGMSERERLAMYYVLENKTRHSANMFDMISAQAQYIPNIDAFRDVMKATKAKVHRYVMGDQFYWDKLADAYRLVRGYKPAIVFSTEMIVDRQMKHQAELEAADETEIKRENILSEKESLKKETIRIDGEKQPAGDSNELEKEHTQIKETSLSELEADLKARDDACESFLATIESMQKLAQASKGADKKRKAELEAIYKGMAETCEQYRVTMVEAQDRLSRYIKTVPGITEESYRERPDEPEPQQSDAISKAGTAGMIASFAQSAPAVNSLFQTISEKASESGAWELWTKLNSPVQWCIHNIRGINITESSIAGVAGLGAILHTFSVVRDAAAGWDIMSDEAKIMAEFDIGVEVAKVMQCAAVTTGWATTAAAGGALEIGVGGLVSTKIAGAVVGTVSLLKDVNAAATASDQQAIAASLKNKFEKGSHASQAAILSERQAKRHKVTSSIKAVGDTATIVSSLSGGTLSAVATGVSALASVSALLTDYFMNRSTQEKTAREFFDSDEILGRVIESYGFEEEKKEELLKFYGQKECKEQFWQEICNITGFVSREAMFDHVVFEIAKGIYSEIFYDEGQKILADDKIKIAARTRYFALLKSYGLKRPSYPATADGEPSLSLIQLVEAMKK